MKTIKILMAFMAMSMLQSCGDDDSDEVVLSSHASFTAFSISQENRASIIDQVNRTIDIEVFTDVDLTSLIAEFTVSENAMASIGAVEQVSGVTPNDFTNPVIYTIEAEDNSTKQWEVRVTAVNPGPEITVTTLVNDFPGNDELSIDNNGNIFVNSHGQNGVLNGSTVYKVTPTGEVSLFASSLPIFCVGSYFDDRGNLFVTGHSSGQITKIGATGTKELVASGINGAGSLIVDMNDNIYVAEYFTNSVIKILPNGQKEVFASDFPIAGSAGLTHVRQTGDLYVSNWLNGKIVKINSVGGAETFVTLPVTSVGPLINFGGFIYAMSPTFHKIYKINIVTKEVELFVGTGAQGNRDGNAYEATFNTPTGLGTTDGITFYLSETNSSGRGRLRVITVGG